MKAPITYCMTAFLVVFQEVQIQHPEKLPIILDIIPENKSLFDEKRFAF